jgi:hypothetical protein
MQFMRRVFSSLRRRGSVASAPATDAAAVHDAFRRAEQDRQAGRRHEARRGYRAVLALVRVRREQRQSIGEAPLLARVQRLRLRLSFSLGLTVVAAALGLGLALTVQEDLGRTESRPRLDVVRWLAETQLHRLQGGGGESAGGRRGGAGGETPAARAASRRERQQMVELIERRLRESEQPATGRTSIGERVQEFASADGRVHQKPLPDWLANQASSLIETQDGGDRADGGGGADDSSSKDDAGRSSDGGVDGEKQPQLGALVTHNEPLKPGQQIPGLLRDCPLHLVVCDPEDLPAAPGEERAGSWELSSLAMLVWPNCEKFESFVETYRKKTGMRKSELSTVARLERNLADCFSYASTAAGIKKSMQHAARAVCANDREAARALPIIIEIQYAGTNQYATALRCFERFSHRYADIYSKMDPSVTSDTLNITASYIFSYPQLFHDYLSATLKALSRSQEILESSNIDDESIRVFIQRRLASADRSLLEIYVAILPSADTFQHNFHRAISNLETEPDDKIILWSLKVLYHLRKQELLTAESALAFLIEKYKNANTFAPVWNWNGTLAYLDKEDQQNPARREVNAKARQLIKALDGPGKSAERLDQLEAVRGWLRQRAR